MIFLLYLLGIHITSFSLLLRLSCSKVIDFISVLRLLIVGFIFISCLLNDTSHHVEACLSLCYGLSILILLQTNILVFIYGYFALSNRLTLNSRIIEALRMREIIFLFGNWLLREVYFMIFTWLA